MREITRTISRILHVSLPHSRIPTLPNFIHSRLLLLLSRRIQLPSKLSWPDVCLFACHEWPTTTISVILHKEVCWLFCKTRQACTWKWAISPPSICWVKACFQNFVFLFQLMRICICLHMCMLIVGTAKLRDSIWIWIWYPDSNSIWKWHANSKISNRPHMPCAIIPHTTLTH